MFSIDALQFGGLPAPIFRMQLIRMKARMPPALGSAASRYCTGTGSGGYIRIHRPNTASNPGSCQNFRIHVDAETRPVRPRQLGKQQRDVACAGPDVEHRDAGSDARRLESLRVLGR